ncbi:MAG: hypothetical protein NTV09_03100 [Bacteroidetes bacterium]|nr:hypothetical protein [Bacteroidota bacterium]
MKKLLLLFILFFPPNIKLLAGAINADSLPELNRKIIAFVDSKMKKKVGRGECWDLAAFALNEAGASWNGKLKFGRLLDPKTETVLPGDIIQFEGVKIKFEKGGTKYKEILNHHTGIIYSVISPMQFDLANQNTAQYGRKVGLSFIDLEQVTSGRYFIYRPVR